MGKLYAEGDPRRDAGFTIFYMGINVGAFTATLLCGWLGEVYGWSWGFGAAGIGMLLGLILFQWGHKFLLGHGEPAKPQRLGGATGLPGINLERAIYLGSIALVLIVCSWCSLPIRLARCSTPCRCWSSLASPGFWSFVAIESNDIVCLC